MHLRIVSSIDEASSEGLAPAMDMYQHDGPRIFRFVLSGELSDDAVHQLAWSWQTAKSILGDKELIVDISGLAKADAPGLELLFRMREAGACLKADLPAVSPEFLGQLGVSALAPRSYSGWLARICRRIVSFSTAASQSAKKGEVSKCVRYDLRKPRCG